MIPAELADELYDRLVEYYRDDPNVKVIVDRRRQSGPPPEGEERRRARITGTFPAIEPQD